MPLWRSRSNKTAFLRKVPLFDGLSSKQLERVARLADQVEVSVGKRLATIGEVGRELFVIVDGEAVVTTRKGRTVKLGRGDFFGEMSLIDGAPRSATVESETPMQLLVIGQREFWQLLADVPPIARKIMTTLSGRLRDADAAFSPSP